MNPMHAFIDRLKAARTDFVAMREAMEGKGDLDNAGGRQDSPC